MYYTIHFILLNIYNYVESETLSDYYLRKVFQKLWMKKKRKKKIPNDKASLCESILHIKTYLKYSCCCIKKQVVFS